jgi:cytosine/adenosine deaminase-related metal-dependent hydrolase
MSDGDLLIRGGTLLHLDPVKVERADVRIRGGEIVEVGADLAEGAEPIMDAAGAWVMPGLVCGHHHLYSALACGMPFVEEPPINFADMLAKVWWRLDRALDEEAVDVSARAGAVSALRAGTTTIIDHHASPSFIEGSLEVMDDAIGAVGQRRVLCYEVTDRGGLERAAAGLRAHEGLLKRGPTGESAALVGIHANFTVGDRTLKQCAELAREHGVGLHIHVAEAHDDETVTGEPLIMRMERLDALIEDSILAHCVHLHRNELRRALDAGCKVSHQTRSNMNNAVGYAPLLYFGDDAILGTDGIDGDMFAELKTAYFRAQEGGVGLDPAGALRLLTNSARYASRQLGVTLGKLEVGAVGDVVLLDPCVGPPLLSENLAAAMIFRLTASQVRSVVVGGRLRLEDRRVTGLNEGTLAERAEKAALAVWDRMKELEP